MGTHLVKPEIIPVPRPMYAVWNTFQKPLTKSLNQNTLLLHSELIYVIQNHFLIKVAEERTSNQK